MNLDGYKKIEEAFVGTDAIYYIKPEPLEGQDIKIIEIQVWEPYGPEFILECLQRAGLILSPEQGIEGPELKHQDDKTYVTQSKASPGARKITHLTFEDITST